MLENDLINLLGEKIIELNKIKVVLLALWKYDIKQQEANKIIEEFEKELGNKNFEETNKLITRDNIETIQKDNNLEHQNNIGEQNVKTM